MPPIIIFAYLRHDLLKAMLDSLAQCRGMEGRRIFVFQDGLKDSANEHARDLHQKTSEVIRTAAGDLWNIELSSVNLGLAQSVYKGVSAVLSKHSSAIVLEDDLLLANDFLEFMDQCLLTYQDRQDVYSISGFTHMNRISGNPGVFLFPRPGSWGWATWADRWNGFRLDVIPSAILKERELMRQFDKGGEDMSWMLRNSLKGLVNSWAIQWAWYQFVNHAFSIYPECSKVRNSGFGEGATHTRGQTDGVGIICENKVTINAQIMPDEQRIRNYAQYYRLGRLSKIRKVLGM